MTLSFTHANTDILFSPFLWWCYAVKTRNKSWKMCLNFIAVSNKWCHWSLRQVTHNLAILSLNLCWFPCMRKQRRGFHSLCTIRVVVWQPLTPRNTQLQRYTNISTHMSFSHHKPQPFKWEEQEEKRDDLQRRKYLAYGNFRLLLTGIRKMTGKKILGIDLHYSSDNMNQRKWWQLQFVVFNLTGRSKPWGHLLLLSVLKYLHVVIFTAHYFIIHYY